MPSAGFAVAPMLIFKNDLLKPLKAITAFDPKGAPYVAVQLVEGYKPLFLRTNNDGIIQSKNFGLFPTSYVSLNHLVSVLKNCPEDSIELSTNERGIMRMYGTSEVGSNSETHVHTVHEKQAGVKTHDIGPSVLTLNSNTFSGVDISKYTLTTEPVVAQGKLMLSTNKGAVVMWSNELLASQPIKLSPRESFLRMVCGQEVEEMALTQNGYWGATIGDLVTYTKGHVLGRQLFDSYNQSGVEVAQLPAERLLTCLKSAIGLLEEADRIDIDPKVGVIAKGTFGDNRNSLGETGGWSRFGLQAKTAKVIFDTLSQASDDYVKLEQVSQGSNATMRMVRGSFSVNFRSFSS